MKRQQVFVRARDDNGRIFNCDVLDLDDASFRAFVVGKLHRAGIVVGMRDESIEGDHIELRARPGVLRPADE